MTAAKRKRGRPALDSDRRAADVRVRMPSRLYDRLYELSTTHGLSVPAVIRRILTRSTRTTTRPDL
jgi:hypothetical protein